MSIKQRFGLSFLAVVALSAVLQFLVLRHAVQPSFDSIELDLARRDLQRPVDALGSEVQHLVTLNRDWASWDETWSFVRGENPEYEAENFYPDVYPQNNVELIYAIDLQGHVVVAGRRSPEEGEPVALAEFPSAPWAADHWLLRRVAAVGSTSGLLMSECGPMLVSAEPILRNGGEGPRAGTLIMGRLLDDDMIEGLRSRTQVDFRLLHASDGQLSPPDRSALEALSGDVAQRFDQELPATLTGSTLIRDMRDRPALLLRANVRRTVSGQGQSTIRTATLLGLGGAGLVLVVLFVLLDLGVIAPLLQFTSRVVSLKSRPRAPAELVLERSDEIGILSHEFADLYGAMQELQSRAIVASNLAGKSEVATSVLHNVGNMLNGVTVSSAALAERARRLPAGDLELLAQRLTSLGDGMAEWLTNDPAGRRLPEFLESLAKRLRASQEDMRGMCTELGSRVGEIAAVISAQQGLASGDRLVEDFDLGEQVEVALQVTMPSRCGVEVRRARWESLRVTNDRIRLGQILVNLVKNAMEAYVGVEGRRPWIELSVYQEGGRAHVVVRDDACGIAPENLERVFQHGYTTKARGHGFGLHSAATLALEMGGRLSASSPGVGRGALFHVEFPIESAKPALAHRAPADVHTLV